MSAKRTGTVWAILGLLAAFVALGGCNTWKGVGKDVERAGEKIQGEP